MASIALTAVAITLAAPTGGASIGIGAALLIGASGAVGAYLDQQFVYPAIFGRQTGAFTGPRLDDMNVQIGSEGSSLRFCYGPLNRVAGVVIWMPKLREEQSTSSSGGGKGGGGPSSTSFTYFANVAIHVCDCTKDGPIAGVDKIWADSKLIYDSTTGSPAVDSRYEDIQFYLGTDSQMPAALIEEFEGSGTVEAYRGHAYVTIRDLNLSDWGNRLPNFRFQVRRTGQNSVASVLKAICKLSGMSDEEIDTTQVYGTMQGYSFVGPAPVAQYIEPLLMVYGLGVQITNGKIVFYKRGKEASLRPLDGDLGTQERGTGDAKRPYQITDVSDVETPRKLSVKFIDPALDYQQGSVTAQAPIISNVDVQIVDVPMAISRTVAKRLAERILWSTQVERQSFEATLPFAYLSLQEGDLLDVEDFTVRVDTLTRGFNGLMEVRGTLIDPRIHASYLSSANPTYTGSVVFVPTNIYGDILDLPALTDDEVSRLGVYVVGANSVAGNPFRGFTAFSSSDDTTFSTLNSRSIPSTIGQTGNVLNDNADTKFWDRVSGLQVQLWNGTLTSKTEEEVLAGANRALVGNEIIGFKTATLTAPGAYTLTTLLRGLRDTPTDGHILYDRFILLERGLVGFSPFSSSYIGASRFYRFAAPGQNVTTLTSVSRTFIGKTTKQFAVCKVSGSRASNVNMSWTRRSRVNGFIFGSNGSVLHTLESYEIDIKLGGVLKRTITTTTPSLTYTAAQQTTDGTTGAALVATIFQIGPNGRGNVATVNIPTSGAF